MSLKLTTLPNNLRIISDHVPEMHSVAIGVWVDVGTRYEALELNGIAHMVEHMMFKGTPRRGPSDIAETIENVGGQMNAYTSREQTAYFIHLLKDDLYLALDLLADILQHSTFPDNEIDKERSVIAQEIGMTQDTPDDLIFDLHQETAYPGQGLGAPILGKTDIIQNTTQQNLFDYVRHFYRPSRLVISAAGYVEHEELVARVEELFGGMKDDPADRLAPPADYRGGEYRGEKVLEQTHIVMGFRGIPRTSEEFHATQLLSTLLGGGLSSRLFQEVREKRGLVYSIYSDHDGYRDDGLFEIYAGTGPDLLGELVPVVCDELNKLRVHDVKDTELARAKAQLKAGLLMNRESMLSRADRQAKYLFNFNKAPNIEQTLQSIDAVNPAHIRDLSERIFNSAPTVAALGPLNKLESYEDIKTRLTA